LVSSLNHHKFLKMLEKPKCPEVKAIDIKYCVQLACNNHKLSNLNCTIA
jgi:hypothetical protein